MHIYGICLFLWKANVIGYLVDLCVCVFVHAHDYVYRGHLYFILLKTMNASQARERKGEREKLSPMTTKRPYKRFLSLECRYSCHRCQFNGEHGGYSYHHRHHCHCHHRPRCVKLRMTSQPAIGSSM